MYSYEQASISRLAHFEQDWYTNLICSFKIEVRSMQVPMVVCPDCAATEMVIDRRFPVDEVHDTVRYTDCTFCLNGKVPATVVDARKRRDRCQTNLIFASASLIFLVLWGALTVPQAMHEVTTSLAFGMILDVVTSASVFGIFLLNYAKMTHYGDIVAKWQRERKTSE